MYSMFAGKRTAATTARPTPRSFEMRGPGEFHLKQRKQRKGSLKTLIPKERKERNTGHFTLHPSRQRGKHKCTPPARFTSSRGPKNIMQRVMLLEMTQFRTRTNTDVSSTARTLAGTLKFLSRTTPSTGKPDTLSHVHAS